MLSCSQSKFAFLLSLLVIICHFRSSFSIPTPPKGILSPQEPTDSLIPVLDKPTPVLSDPKSNNKHDLSKEDRLAKLDEKLGIVLDNYEKNPIKKREPHLASETAFSQTWNFINSSTTSRLGVVRNAYCSSSDVWYSESGLVDYIINKAIGIVLNLFDIPSAFVTDTQKFLDWLVSKEFDACSVPYSFCLVNNGGGDYSLEGISTSGYSACFYISDLQLVICPAVSWTWDTWYQDVECAYENQFCVGYLDLGVRVFDLEYSVGGMIAAHIGESAMTAAEDSVLVKGRCANMFFK